MTSSSSGGRQEILTRGGKRQEVVAGAVAPRQEVVTAPRQVFYTSAGNRPSGQTIHTLVNTSNGPVLTPVTVLGTDSKVKTLLPADRLRPQPVQARPAAAVTVDQMPVTYVDSVRS